MNASTDTGAPSSGTGRRARRPARSTATRPALIRTLGPHTGNVQRGGGAGSTGQACQRRRRTGRVASRPMAATTIGWREWVGPAGAGSVGPSRPRSTPAPGRRPCTPGTSRSSKQTAGPAPAPGPLRRPPPPAGHWPRPSRPRSTLWPCGPCGRATARSRHRPVIRTPVVIDGRRYAIELTLTRRDEMGFRMLLGRRALRRRFVIDPGRSFLCGGSTVAPSSQVGPGAATV